MAIASYALALLKKPVGFNPKSYLMRAAVAGTPNSQSVNTLNSPLTCLIWSPTASGSGALTVGLVLNQTAAMFPPKAGWEKQKLQPSGVCRKAPPPEVPVNRSSSLSRL